MLENFNKVKITGCGPDGVAPILTKHIVEKEDKLKIIKEALEQNGLFDTRVTFVPKGKKGEYRPINVSNLGSRWFEKSLLPYIEKV